MASNSQPPPARPRESFFSRHARALAYVLAVLVSLPALFSGVFHDDLAQRLGLEGKLTDPVAPHLLYDLTGSRSNDALVQEGLAPWFIHPEFSMRFFRPLSSALIAGEYQLFGRATLPSHLIALAWFLVLIVIVEAIFRRVLSPSRAKLALVLFAVAGAHTMNLAWIATRHSHVGAVFGAVAVLLSIARRAPQGRFRPPPWSGLAALLVAMLASETALAAAVMLVFYEVFVSPEPARVRALEAAKVVGLVAAYLAFYALSGYGVKHSALYVSAFTDPLAFVAAAASRVPVLLGELAGAVPSDLWGAAVEARPALVTLGLAAFAWLAFLLFRARLSPEEARLVRWLSASAVVSVLPMASGVVGGRLLVVPAIASTALVAIAIDATRQRALAQPAFLTRAAAGALLGVHLVLPFLVRIGLPLSLQDIAGKQRKLASDAELSACPEGGTALLMTGSDPTLSLYLAATLGYYTPDAWRRFRGFRVMSMAPGPQRLERPGERELVLLTEGERKAGMFEALFSDAPLAVGQRRLHGEMTATVEETHAGLWTRVRFGVPEDSCMLIWERGALRGRPLPAVGEQVALAHEPGPMGL